MTQKEKQLLLKDICGRFPYDVKINHQGYIQELTVIVLEDIIYSGHEIKPYLRPMSSITEEEMFDFHENGGALTHYFKYDIDLNCLTVSAIDWLNKHHFDYRGLIEKGLALEALEGMYNIK